MGDLSGPGLSYSLSSDLWVAGSMTRDSDVRKAFEDIAKSYGFHGFLVMLVPSRAARRLSECVVMTNWPKGFLESYDAASLMSGSPVIERLRRSTIPFTYDTAFDARRRSDGKASAVLSLFESVRLARGVYIPVHDVHGTCGAVSFGGEREVASSVEIKELTFLASVLFSRLGEIRGGNRAPPGGLSRREIECLHWAAAGKTTTEMAQILKLSEYTVNHYLSRATRKLDSVNRVQTVAKAIRAGLIN
ncbi:helix-turn-helix transcriptional regulator [Pararhizobium gei]|uniref:helix-turn-helix transcriptional regulator n=1 Tax=Pararhizobium gei TaxID=1395951 RepID=UPI003D9C7612